VRAVETLIVVISVLLLVTVASGYAYTYALNQSRAGEVTYAINVLFQLAEGIDGIVNHRGGSSTLRFDFRYGAIVSAAEQQYSLSISINGDEYNLPPTGAPVYKTCRVHYFIPFSMYPSVPILDRGTENKTSDAYIVSSLRSDEPNLVYHYSTLGRTYVEYLRQPLVSIVRTAGKVSVHVIFLTFSQVALKTGPATFVLDGDAISSFYIILASQQPTVTLNLKQGTNPIQVNIGNQLSQGDYLQQGNILEVFAHQLTVTVR
jgi:hypothetical protein